MIVKFIVASHDCFYSNMNNFRFISNIDIDEVFFPNNNKDLKSLVANQNMKLKHRHLKFERSTILDKMRKFHGWNPAIPSHMYLLKNIYKSIYHTKVGPKTLMNTESALEFGSHYPRLCLRSQCRFLQLPYDQASCFHYRGECKEGLRKYCDTESSIKDTRIWKYQEELIKQTSSTLKKLKLI